ncbi:MAG: alpha-ketoglutarate-dependent dioxygenase AlkB [Actinobacteria bacterium]|nr:alpha-ketoglutarate-dependent dioxygenase AlkB [Actinomycetota bacterium]MSZ29935.1 alpha-ketoglutarate-dependent dioxygenase AlkB [Actinomycetota bacterium]
MDTPDMFASEEPRELLFGASSAVLHSAVLEPDKAHEAFENLLAHTPWEQRDVVVFGRSVAQPRLVAWVASPPIAYRYAGMTLEAHAFTPLLLELKKRVEVIAGAQFNSVLLNLYRTGADSNGWHADDEFEFGIDPIIASLSLGATRRFDLRNRETKETIKTNLASGDLVVMSGECQREWIHQVPKQLKVLEPRINLTFRMVQKPIAGE